MDSVSGANKLPSMLINPSSKPLDLGLRPEDWAAPQEPNRIELVDRHQSVKLGQGSAQQSLSIFDAQIAPKAEAPQPVTKREFLNNLQTGLEDTIGKPATAALIGVGGIAHLAKGGKVKFSQSTDHVVQGSKLQFEVSKKGGSVKWGFEF